MAKFKVDELWFSREISELINSMPQILIAFISRQFVRVISCMSTDLATSVLSILWLARVVWAALVVVWVVR